MSAKNNTISPLRYPGGKRRLAAYLAESLKANGLRPKLFVEPFAGGASVALQMLGDDQVDEIVLGELDPLVASFWKCVFFDSEWLVKKIESVPVTLERWNYYRSTSFSSDRKRAIACIFLNRTSFSGILCEQAGPIGGKAQTSDYKIDCRFSRDTLAKRVRQLAALKDRVRFVNKGHWSNTVNRVQKLGYKMNEVFYYFDPPFYEKADRLYRHFFDDDDHTELHNRVIRIHQPWLLSYDAAPTIKAMYSHNSCVTKHVDLLYSITGANENLTGKRELIITNLAKLPRKVKLWKASSEWASLGAGSHRN